MTKIIYKAICILLSLIIVFVFCGCGRVVSPIYVENKDDKNLNSRLIIDGSTSMTKLCNSLGESFALEHAGVTVEKLDTGSSAAVNSVQNGTADLGALSRNLNDTENPGRFNVIKIANDGIMLIVNKDNNISDLSHDDIYMIFTKTITKWSSFSGRDENIVLIGREEASGTKDGFESAFGLIGKCKYDAIFSEAGDIIAQVGSDKNAIGYVSMASGCNGVKAVSVDGVMPSKTSVLNGTYPIVRPFIMIFMEHSSNRGLIDKWFDFLGSSEASEIIEKEGFVATGN